ncbi:MAG: tetratricopeptide repeat protein [Tabrizicola sp.]|nr:tetratricopeptide repeat protein [Tabrizicola sp.]
MPKPWSRILTPLLLAAVIGAPLRAEDTFDPGAYLAARVAEAENDFPAASEWYGKANAADPTNPRILEGALLAEIGIGDFDLAYEAAGLLKSMEGEQSQLAELALLAGEAQREDYATILAAAQAGRDVGGLSNALVTAWAKVGEGKMSEAIAEFDSLAETKGLEAFGYYHKALSLALAGDFQGADDILSGKVAGPIFMMRRGILAHAQILSQLERNADALALLDKSFGTRPDPVIDALRRRLAAGEPVPFDTVQSARDGIAEAFYTISTALNGEEDPVYTLIHLRIATYLLPANADAQLLLADVLGALKLDGLAVETYANFSADSPYYVGAEIGRANALRAQGKADAAVEALQSLAKEYGDLVSVQFSLGEVLQAEDRFDEAEVAYSAAIELRGAPTEEDWVLYFYRGICHEQSKDWQPAEADFRQALALNPTQPQVLNYLGYGLIDRGEKLDEALGMIRKAVAGDPDQGYIIDSLAWAYFKLGRYDEALEPMEKASLLEPVDPIVTDHLGDVYWMVGRKREAEFQWHRALSFEPTEKDASRILRKLEIGLDAVMAEEAAAEPAVETTENGN